MDTVVAPEKEQQGQGCLNLIGLILGLAVGALVLAHFGGLPRLPASLPSWDTIGSTLRGSHLPLEVLAYVFTMLAWAVWFWIVVSLLLRLIVGVAQGFPRGLPAVGALQAVSDRVTLPIVRRAVDGALLTVFVANIVSRTALSVAAASPVPASTHHTVAVQRTKSDDTTRRVRGSRSIEYTVQPGDSLWGIAQQFYGTGEEFPRLVSANVGRLVSDGARFTQAGVIQPGWVLRVPLPSQAVEVVGNHSYYLVEEGDTLQGIAARVLGGENRWTELFDLNRDRARLNGHVLTDPNLIWPGLRLSLPEPPAAATSRHPPAGGPGTVHSPRPRPKPTPIVPSPTAVPATPIPTSPAPTPVPVSTPIATARPSIGLPADEIGLIAGAAGVAAAGAGAAALLVRRRVRRSLDEPPVPLPTFRPPPGDDFLDTEPDRVLAHRLHAGEEEPAILVAERASRFFAGQGIPVSVIWAERGRDATTLLLAAEREDRMRILELAGSFGTRLGGKGRAAVTPDGDVALQVEGLKGGSLLAAAPPLPKALPLLPLGVLSRGEVLSVNWEQIGHVLISGLPGEGTDITLTALLSALTAHCHPDMLRLWMVADDRALPSQLQRLPHVCDAIDPHDSDRVGEVLEHVRAELLRRMQAAGESEDPWYPSREEPELVLVMGDLAELADGGTTLELIGNEGPHYGVRLLAATTRADVLNEMLAHFSTRLVLMTMDEAESISLLGRPEAADLSSGEFFARIVGRTPMRVRGFRVAPDHLEALNRLMGEAYGSGSHTVLIPAEADQSSEDLSDLDTEPTRMDGNSHFQGMAPLQGQGDTAVDVPPDGRVPLEHVAGVVDTLQTANVSDVAELDDEDFLDQAEQPVVDLEMVPQSGEREATAHIGGVVRVRCFGGFHVEAEGGEITPAWAEGTSHLAWQLLAYLCAQPTGTVPREKLLADMWPDVDSEHAGLRMRQAMFRLRSALSLQVPGLTAEVVRADRDGFCRLEPTLVTSDVRRFVSLLRDASRLRGEEAKAVLEEARSLYRGDLLSGVETREYEWLDERDESGVTLREYYREQYSQATRKLARLYYEEGRADRAVPLYKEILRAEPALEDIVRELYRCYGQLGDLTSLIREDRHLRQALIEVYAALGPVPANGQECAPEPETIALFEEIRNELTASAADRPLSQQ